MKKLFAIFIAAYLLIGTTALPVSAEGPCPINYTVKINTDGEYPRLQFEYINTSIYEIKEVIIRMDFCSSDGTIIKKGAVVTISNLNTPGYYTYDSRSYSINSYPGLAYVADFECQKVAFTNNYEWVNNMYSDPRAAFTCLNTAVDNQYETDKGVLKFYDTSLNAYAQKWFFWDDEINGWSQFGDSVSADLETDLPYITIKLEINNNPNLYMIKTLALSHNYINIINYATGEVISANRVFKFKTVTSEFPCMFGFWDTDDSVISRKWYKWDDYTLSWQPISAERGPLLLLETQFACIKLEYNDDPFNYRIIEISVIK